MRNFEEWSPESDLPQGPDSGFVPIEELVSDTLDPVELLMQKEEGFVPEEIDAFEVLEREDDGVPEAWRIDLEKEVEDTNHVTGFENDEQSTDVLAGEEMADRKLTQEAQEEKGRAWHPARYESHKIHGREHKSRPSGPKLGEIEEEAA